MTDQRLKRTPSSTGNRSVHTWSGWIKRDRLSAWERLFSVTGQTLVQFTGINPNRLRYLNQAGGVNFDLQTNELLRDSNSWMNVIIAVDHTLIRPEDRVKIYFNGVRVDRFDVNGSSGGAQDLITDWNEKIEHGLLGRDGANPGENFRGEAFDIYLVDGMQLSPEVFGYYKKDQGYESVGSQKTSMFTPGQWSPRLPKSVKYDINSRGGFGINGFYIPLNDGTNPGADFHCDPNTIVKLKGEDLPQPRNGAPATTDTYVSQLRDDPYAANLVLAVPGLNQNTVTNMVANGNFEKDLVGWTVNGTTTPSIASANFLAEKGTGALITTGTLDGSIWQAVSGSTNQKYLITFDIVQNNGGFFGLYINSNGPNDGGSLVKDNITTIGENYYIRDGNLTAVEFRHRGSSSGIIDNIRVYPLDQSSFRDYSADIRGSGSNKTLTVGGGNPGIIASHSFYGSAMSFRHEDSDNISIAGVPAFGTGDWTVEEWVKLPKEFGTQSYWRSSLGVNGDSNIEGAVTIYHTQTAESPSISGGVSFIGKANQYRLYAPHDIRDDNWHHIAVEKYNNVATLYIDGVAYDSAPDTFNYDATNNTRIGVSNTSQSNYFTGEIQDVRVYQGVAKYKGGFDVSKPYTPVGFAPGSWRTTPASSRNKFVTMDPIGYQTTGTYGSSVPILTNGNLTVKHGQTGNWERSNATFGASEGKWYFEFKIEVRPEFSGGGNSENWAMGVRETDSKNFYFETDGFEDVGDHVYWMDAVGTGGSAKIVSNQDRSQGSTAGISNVSNGDVINVAFEKTATTLKVWFGINGTYFNSGNPSTGASPAVNVSTTSMYIMPSVAFYQYSGQAEAVGTFNFGQNPSFSGAEVTAGTNTDASGKGLFKYSVPTDFNCICTQNLTAPAIADPGEHFKPVLYTGSGGVQSINKVGYKPDLVWLKCRSDGKWHALVDSVRGNTKTLFSNDSTTEVSETHVPSFNSDGFTVDDIDSGTANEDGFDYVAWCWKAGGPSVTNTDGSITSQVSVNQTAGFSIVTYTGNGSGTATVGHGLNKTPAFSIIKSRDSGGSVNDWWTYIGSDDYARVRLNTNIASTIGDNQNALKHAPDTSVFTLSNFLDNNVKYIVYSWAEVENFSKVGTYLGNGNADGPMIVCGFKPAWVMVKRLDAGNEGWPIYDNVRGSYNPNAKGLYANDPLLENDAAGRYKDFLSNGFKIRGTSGEQNTNGARYLYVAFAESPFLTANAK